MLFLVTNIHIITKMARISDSTTRKRIHAAMTWCRLAIKRHAVVTVTINYRATAPSLTGSVLQCSIKGPEHIAQSKWKRHDDRVSGLSNILINTSVAGKTKAESCKTQNLSFSSFHLPFLLLPSPLFHPRSLWRAYRRRLVLACRGEGGCHSARAQVSRKTVWLCQKVNTRGRDHVNRSVKNMFTRYRLSLLPNFDQKLLFGTHLARDFNNLFIAKSSRQFFPSPRRCIFSFYLIYYTIIFFKILFHNVYIFSRMFLWTTRQFLDAQRVVCLFPRRAPIPALGQISTVYSRGSCGSWRYLCNVTRLDAAREKPPGRRERGIHRIHALLEYNPCARRRVAGRTLILLTVDPDQERPTRPLLCMKPPRIITLLSLAGIARGGGSGIGHRQSSQITRRLELVSRRWVQMHTNIYADRDRPPGMRGGRPYKGISATIFDYTFDWLFIRFYRTEIFSGEVLFAAFNRVCERSRIKDSNEKSRYRTRSYEAGIATSRKSLACLSLLLFSIVDVALERLYNYRDYNSHRSLHIYLLFFSRV